MQILFKSTRSGKRYKLKESVIEVAIGAVGVIMFILSISFIQNLAIYWGIATW